MYNEVNDYFEKDKKEKDLDIIESWVRTTTCPTEIDEEDTEKKTEAMVRATNLFAPDLVEETEIYAEKI